MVVRQLRRAQPLEVEEVEGIRIPTVAEMIRVESWLIVRRNVTRDYVDVCALTATAGEDASVEALASLDRLYPQETDETVLRQLCKQLAEPRTADLDEVDLSQYRGIQPPWNQWENVASHCGRLSNLIAERLLGL